MNNIIYNKIWDGQAAGISGRRFGPKGVMLLSSPGGFRFLGLEVGRSIQASLRSGSTGTHHPVPGTRCNNIGIWSFFPSEEDRDGFHDFLSFLVYMLGIILQDFTAAEGLRD